LLIFITNFLIHQAALEDQQAPGMGSAVAPKHGRGRYMTHPAELAERGLTYNPGHYARPVLPLFHHVE
jgi:hypothetical protein